MNTRTYPRTMNGVNGAFRDAEYATACHGLQRALLARRRPSPVMGALCTARECLSMLAAFVRGVPAEHDD